MIATSWGLVLILAHSACGGHGPDGPAACCDTCGAPNAAIVEQIVRMQKSPNWRARDDAAHALRRYDWRCHPEVAEALCFTLLHDGHEEVREEAAQSLTRMRPCLAVVHESLARAAASERDFCTRRWARKGLRALGDRCEGACRVCEPALVGPATAPASGTFAITVPSPAPGAVVEPVPMPDPAAGVPGVPEIAPIEPPAALPGGPAPPIDSRVGPAPDGLAPLPPPAAAAEDPVRTADAGADQARAKGRGRRLPFGLKLPSFLPGIQGR